jgi:hypothetical protein
MEMEESRNDQHGQTGGASSRHSFWIAMSAFVVAAVAGVMLYHYNRQQALAMEELRSREANMTTAISDLQIEALKTAAKLNEITAAQAAATTQATANVKDNTRGSTARTSSADANRLRQLQASIDQQKKALQSTQADITQTRSALEGSLSSTRDELNGSIAKTHDELVLLQKRGERNYSEFDAVKSKNFQHAGPLSVSLRKTDSKHQHVDLVFLVNDHEIGKKSLNLYEPVWVYSDKDSEPVQVVVNKIDKNSIHGYVSAPKYSTTELAPTTTVTE